MRENLITSADITVNVVTWGYSSGIVFRLLAGTRGFSKRPDPRDSRAH
jgi:hypothetical protein